MEAPHGNSVSAEAPVEESLVAEAPREECVLAEAPMEESLLAEAPREESLLAEAPCEESLLAEAPLEESVLAEAPLEESVLAEAPVEESVLAEAPLEQSVLAEAPSKESVLAEAPMQEWASTAAPGAACEGPTVQAPVAISVRQQIQNFFSSHAEIQGPSTTITGFDRLEVQAITTNTVLHEVQTCTSIDYKLNEELESAVDDLLQSAEACVLLDEARSEAEHHACYNLCGCTVT